jgi:hypothetical protein
MNSSKSSRAGLSLDHQRRTPRAISPRPTLGKIRGPANPKRSIARHTKTLSGTVCHLAKVGVEGSNPFARSNVFRHLAYVLKTEFFLG